MTTKKEKLFINIVLAVFIAGIICCFTLYPILCETVSAEELTNTSVLNFNQLFDYSKLNSSKITDSYYVTFSVNAGGYYSLDQKISFVAGHKYYIYGAVPGVGGLHFDSTPSHPSFRLINVSNFITAEYTDSYQFFVYGFSTGTFKSIIQIFDLTQCFGSGNEPSTVDEFKSYFNNEYYSYTSSTLISLDTLQSYNNGVADTLNSYKYVISANDSYNNLIPYGEYTEMTRGVDSNGRYYNEFTNSVNIDNLKCAYFGFAGGILSSGSKLTLTGYCLQGQTSPEGVDVAVLVGSNFVNVGHLIATRESWKYNTISFTLPYASSGIYFIGLGSSSFKLSDFVIEIETTDFDTLYGLAFKRGQDSRDGDVTIAFENGKKVGMTQANPYTFNSLFGAVFDAPIQALTGLLDFDILGVNMKGLYLSLFTLALIIFVVKLCLGKV